MITKKLTRYNLIKVLDSYIILNVNTLKRLISKNSSYTRLVLHRLKKMGIITQIERNSYTTKKDPFLIASHITWPSYISLWSALNYHHLTEQLPKVISIVSTKPRKVRRINVLNVEISFIRIKPENFFGFKKENYNGANIFVAEKEKALIDAALLRKISFSEISEMVKSNVNDLDLKLLVSYLLRIKNNSLIKRFGFLLDSLGFDFYKELKGFIDAKYVLLDYSLQANEERNKKWRVINNVA